VGDKVGLALDISAVLATSWAGGPSTAPWSRASGTNPSRSSPAPSERCR